MAYIVLEKLLYAGKNADPCRFTDFPDTAGTRNAFIAGIGSASNMGIKVTLICTYGPF
jgi:hypothetical protein